MDKKDLPIIENATYIPLSQGEWALVDDEVALIAPKFHLWKHKTTDKLYGKRAIKVDNKWTTQLLHRFVLEYYKIDAPVYIDHINGNGLDNRKDNLRASSGTQNQGNRNLNKNNKSGCRGVSWRKDKGKWRAEIKIDGKSKHLGSFDDIVIAARMRDRAAIEHFGKFAFDNLNFPVTDYLTPGEIQEMMSK